MHLFQAKAEVKQAIAGIKVACFVHVDKGSDNKRTYFASEEAWHEAMMSYGQQRLLAPPDVS